MAACTYIERIVGRINLDWPGTPMLTVKQKYDSNSFDHVSNFASPRTIHLDPTSH